MCQEPQPLLPQHGWLPRVTLDLPTHQPILPEIVTVSGERERERNRENYGGWWFYTSWALQIAMRSHPLPTLNSKPESSPGSTAHFLSQGQHRRQWPCSGISRLLWARREGNHACIRRVYGVRRGAIKLAMASTESLQDDLLRRILGAPDARGAGLCHWASPTSVQARKMLPACGFAVLRGYAHRCQPALKSQESFSSGVRCWSFMYTQPGRRVARSAAWALEPSLARSA